MLAEIVHRIICPHHGLGQFWPLVGALPAVGIIGRKLLNALRS
jgi:hypothetical protein